jgi:cobalt-zinc-cadmium efflux system outer membrane protein
VTSAAVGLAGLCLLAGCARFQAQPLLPDETAAQFEARSLDDPGLQRFIRQNLPREASAGGPPAVGPSDRRPAPSDASPAPWDFDTLTLVALYYNPSLDVARAQWAVAQAGVKTAGQRPNPTGDLSPQYTSNSPSGESPWVAALAFDGLIETAGKRGYRVAQAQQLSEAARLSLATQAWQVRSNLRTSLLDNAAAQQRVILLEHVRNAQEQILKLLEARLAAGDIAAAELTTPRVALIQTLADLAEARRQTVDSRAAVALALGVPLRAIEGRELRFDLRGDGVGPSNRGQDALNGGIGIEPMIRRLDTDATIQGRDALTTAQMRRQALHHRADILAALAEYAASQSALQLEIARQYPDIRLGPGYEYDQGLHKWGLAVGADFLPVFHRNQGPIAEAQARRAEAAARFLALQAQVIGELDRALAGVTAAREQLRQVDALLDTQQKNVRAIEARVAAGAADRFELRTTELEAATTELVRLDALVKVQQALGRLEDAVQVPFDALQTVEQNPRASDNRENKS